MRATQFVEVTSSSAGALVAAMGDEGNRVTPRFERGSRAFAVVEAGKVVSYGWLSTATEWIGELGVEISPDAGEAYIWNCLTLPEHRRRSHYRALLEGIVAQAREPADGEVQDRDEPGVGVGLLCRVFGAADPQPHQAIASGMRDDTFQQGPVVTAPAMLPECQAVPDVSLTFVR